MALSRDEQLVQDALENALKRISANVADPRLRARLFDKVEEAKLMHKGSVKDR